MIFGRSAKKGNAPDVDLLDRIREGASRFRDGLSERVEIADHYRDGRN